MSEENNSLEYAAGWRPEENDVIIGRVLELSVGSGRWGQYPIVVIRPDDGSGDVAVHAFHHSLRNRLLELKPKQGEKIGIQYKGMRESKSNPGNSFADYRVRIDGRTADDAWNNLQPVGQEPAQQAPTQPQRPAQESLPVTDTDFDTAKTRGPYDDDDIPF